MTRRLVLLRTANHELLISAVFHLNPEGFHQVQRNINVRFRDQVAFDGDDRIPRCQRRSHQQSRQELAGDAAIHIDVTAIETTAQTQRRVIFLLQILNLRAALTKGIHQMANGTLFHAWLTGQHNIVAAQAQGRRQRSHRRPRITQKQFTLFSRA